MFLSFTLYTSISPSIYFSYQKQTVQIFEMFEIKFFDPVPLKCRKESWKKILKGLKSVFILLSNFSCSELLSCSKNLEIQSKLWRDDVWKFNVYLNSEDFCQRRRQVHLMRWWWNDAQCLMIWWQSNEWSQQFGCPSYGGMCVLCSTHTIVYWWPWWPFWILDPRTFPLSWYF